MKTEPPPPVRHARRWHMPDAVAQGRATPTHTPTRAERTPAIRAPAACQGGARAAKGPARRTDARRGRTCRTAYARGRWTDARDGWRDTRDGRTLDGSA